MNSSQSVVEAKDDGTRVWKYVLSQWRDTVKSREQMRKSFKRGEVELSTDCDQFVTTGTPCPI